MMQPENQRNDALEVAAEHITPELRNRDNTGLPG
jgi:hypothetical protein